MHWFWRAMIAFTAGWLCWLAIVLFVSATPSATYARHVIAYSLEVFADFPLSRVGSPATAIERIGRVMIFFVPPFLVAISTFIIVTHLTRLRSKDTACRKCGYILRGITEPRCPECG